MPKVVALPDEILSDGRSSPCFRLESDQGLVARISALGTTLTHLFVRERGSMSPNLVLGFDRAREYERAHPYLGSFVGRYANRIAGAAFEMEGNRYEVDRNHGTHHLHGGREGFHRRLFRAEPCRSPGRVGVEFRITSADGDQGYPGQVLVKARYSVGDDGLLQFDVEGTTDRPTVFAPTQHAYFNLAGKGDILDHCLRVNASAYVPVNAELIPLGVIASVEGTPFDFWSRRPLSDVLTALPAGLDHSFVLNRKSEGPNWACELIDRGSGRSLRLFTDSPAVQVYSGNALDGTYRCDARVFGKHSGICLEPGVPPDAPHQPWRESALLWPGRPYVQTIRWELLTAVDDPA